MTTRGGNERDGLGWPLTPGRKSDLTEGASGGQSPAAVRPKADDARSLAPCSCVTVHGIRAYVCPTCLDRMLGETDPIDAVHNERAHYTPGFDLFTERRQAR